MRLCNALLDCQMMSNPGTSLLAAQQRQHSRGSSHEVFGHDDKIDINVTDDDMQGVVANVSQHYASMVSELLDMLQKTEQSLARVRRNKPADAAAAADGSEMSNIQKISLQLFLDTQVTSSSQPVRHPIC